MFLPYLRATQSTTKQHTTAFLGLNRSDNRQPGEFASQTNLSNRRYPYLAPRLARAKEGFSDPSALFAWDGKEILVEGGQLLYDGQALCNVTAGPKQFAVVNTKLVVWPDKVMVDLTERKVTQMDAGVTNLAEVVFTENSITMAANTVYATASSIYSDRDGCKGPWIWTYSAVSWTAEGGWVLEDPKLTSLFDFNTEGRIYIPAVSWNGGTQKYTLNAPEAVVWAEDKPSGYQEPEPANDLGFYGIISITKSGDWEVGTSYSRMGWDYTYYWAQQVNNMDLTTLFQPGQSIDVSGAATEGNNQTKLLLTDVTANTFTVQGNPFTPGSDGGDVVIRRSIPSLDFICESQNRLWGVSNEDKTIYASALGDPLGLFDYTGEDTDSYAVAVGSEGQFTAICSYDGGVLCWKERTLHKMLGSTPSSYQMVTYHFSGVRAGAHKSLVNMNEALYYLGPDGVYAYSGNVPTLISRALGADVLKEGVAGTDGRSYYLSVRNGESWELLCYDSHTGLWTREDEVEAVDFCRVNDQVKFLAGDAVYTIGGGNEEVEWEGILAPVHETLQDRMVYSRLLIRMEVPKGSYVAADIRFDGGRWLQAGVVNGLKAGTAWLPISIRRCNCFEVRLRGKGDCLILELLREFRLRGKP